MRWWRRLVASGYLVLPVRAKDTLPSLTARDRDCARPPLKATTRSAPFSRERGCVSMAVPVDRRSLRRKAYPSGRGPSARGSHTRRGRLLRIGLGGTTHARPSPLRGASLPVRKSRTLTAVGPLSCVRRCAPDLRTCPRPTPSSACRRHPSRRRGAARPPASMHVHVEIEPDTEIARDEGRERRIIA